MTNGILDFGGRSTDAVIAAFHRFATGQTFKIFVLPVTEEESFDYREFDGELDAALSSVVDGTNGSVQIEGKGGSVLLAGIYRPGFANSNPADWSGSAEGLTSNAEALFEELQTINRLGYVALSEDESPNFDADHITEKTFPWSDWRLIAGAVRAESGKWIVRRKPQRK